MITLFIDTSSFDVSIAILNNDKVLNSIHKNTFTEHSKYAISLIDELLKKSNLKPNEVNHIMVVNGPGSFTGIRIGLTIAKVYAYLLDIKVTLISSLKSIALSYNNDNYIMSLIDAKNDNYYMGLYDNNYNEVIDEHFANIDEILELLDKYKNITIVSNKEIKVDNYKKIDKLDIEKIYLYYKDKEKVNAHKVLPNYLKLPASMENKK